MRGFRNGTKTLYRERQVEKEEILSMDAQLFTISDELDQDNDTLCCLDPTTTTIIEQTKAVQAIRIDK